MEVASLSSPSLNFRPCNKEARFLARSSPTLLSTYTRLQIGCSTYKHASLMSTHHCAQSSSLGMLRKHNNVLWRWFNPKDELFGPHHYYKLISQNKFTRDIVVRSELATTGSLGDGYSLSEPKMESKIRGACFYAVAAFTAIFLFVLMLVGHPYVMLFDRHRRKYHHFIAKIWAMLTVAPFFKIKFEGLENLPPPDTPAVRSQLECLKRCTDLIKKGASVFFFPEGTRSKDGKLGTFKKGAFSIAAKTNVPVVPITLVGTGQIMPAGREDIVNTGSVRVVIHKPINGNDPNFLSEEARNTIASVLNHQD
ncbi:hypothetical protein L6164_011535 [Bauhinia variegata]|uniref:Uncharacterized protein n=1 Tax=Bauhinia variegata TaxID=167791 RepID=A0ACB9P8T6_BAUVA|nr:hypothetical protein L6164_011535 [Bauhinia variegata]